MKTFKITLLFFVVVLIVVVGLWAYNKAVAPDKFTPHNPHIKAMNELIEKTKKAPIADFESEADSLDAYFKEAFFLFRLSKAEGALFKSDWPQDTDGEDKYDELAAAFMEAYAPKFKQQCDRFFEQSVWSSSLLADIERRCGSMDSIYSSDVSGNIREIIRKYHGAWSVARTSFSSIEAARTSISKANNYKNMSPLNNNSGLVQALDELPERLESKHYYHLTYLCNGLNCNSDFGAIRGKLNEYQNNAQSVYGSRRDIDHLYSKINNVVNWCNQNQYRYSY